MQQPIQVNYKSTTNVYIANKYLQEISQYDLFAADFEAAVRYTKEEIESFKAELENNPPKRRKIELESKLKATALDHPSHTVLTHCSIAISDNEAYVFILDNKKITNRVLNFLINTPIRQVWHNASYDFRQIQYRTGKFPILYEDTQIYAKTILNHVETWKANTGLKELAGHKYGAWGISVDNFTKEQMYEEHVLKYAATDACATYWLYNSINNYVKENS
jgi:hypothetical protein